jgi:hypothetical protein
MADLTGIYITNVKQRAEEMYAEKFEGLARNPVISETAKAIIANQYATRAQQLLQASPNDSVDVVWESDDDITTGDCTSDCALTGVPANGNSLTISAPKCIESSLAVSKETARRMGRTVEEETSFLLARTLIKMDNAVNAYTLAQLKAKADAAIAGTLPSYATQASGVIQVPAANYTQQMFADWMLTAIKNRMGMPFMIDDGELYTYYQNALFNSGNSDGKGDQARFNAQQLYFDILGFPAAGLTEDTFIIKSGAVALFHKYYNESTPEYIAGQVNQWRTTIASPSIPGLTYDMFSTVGCTDITGSSHSNLTDVHKVKANIGVFKAPGVGAARPGILLLNKGA